MPHHSFRYCHKLATSGYERLFANHKKLVTPCFVFLWDYSHLPDNQLGMVVAKKNVPLATKRNQLKRLIRESFRQQTFSKQVQVVVLVRYSAATAKKEKLWESLQQAWKKLIKASKQPC